MGDKILIWKLSFFSPFPPEVYTNPQFWDQTTEKRCSLSQDPLCHSAINLDLIHYRALLHATCRLLILYGSRDGHQNLKLLLIDLNQTNLIGFVERTILVFKSSESVVSLQSYGL